MLSLDEAYKILSVEHYGITSAYPYARLTIVAGDPIQPGTSNDSPGDYNYFVA